MRKQHDQITSGFITHQEEATLTIKLFYDNIFIIIL
jgi:hypothetical protein